MADHVTVEVAGTLAGIPARTLRHWIASGKLSAIAGKRGKLVSLREVEDLARIVGKPIGNSAGHVGNPATSAEEVAGNLADSAAATVLVSDAARLQLATIRDEWLAPLVERIGELERENGRLEATGTAQAETIAELRRRAEEAEAELARRHEEEVRAAELLRRRNEQEWRNRERAQTAQEAPGATAALTPDNPSGEPSAGFWARVWRVFGGV